MLKLFLFFITLTRLKLFRFFQLDPSEVEVNPNAFCKPEINQKDPDSNPPGTVAALNPFLRNKIRRKLDTRNHNHGARPQTAHITIAEKSRTEFYTFETAVLIDRSIVGEMLK